MTYALVTQSIYSLKNWKTECGFERGVICLPGIPILLGGCEDRTVPRAIVEFGAWLSLPGDNVLSGTWEATREGLFTRAKGA